ncbi:MAG: nitrile hydratase accessory protein [Rhizobiales bacterium]|nr:nitrile hydratase accessory protein [Hyphomicrobiales bacterium]
MWIAGSLILNVSESEQAALDAVPSIPRNEEGPVFAEPWQAQAFAMTIALYDAGRFTWPEWAEVLSDQLRKAGAEQQGEDYYHHWLSALEQISSTKGLTSGSELAARKEAWDRAAHATPHGQPIVLGAELASD